MQLGWLASAPSSVKETSVVGWPRITLHGCLDVGAVYWLGISLCGPSRSNSLAQASSLGKGSIPEGWRHKLHWGSETHLILLLPHLIGQNKSPVQARCKGGSLSMVPPAKGPWLSVSHMIHSNVTFPVVSDFLIWFTKLSFKTVVPSLLYLLGTPEQICKHWCLNSILENGIDLSI